MGFDSKKLWRHINIRCTQPNGSGYKYYGGRGIRNLITADDLEFLWHRDKPWRFKRWSIDRIDPDGDYTLQNCRFVEMSANRPRRTGSMKDQKAWRQPKEPRAEKAVIIRHLDPILHRTAKFLAAKRDVSLNQFIIDAIGEHISTVIREDKIGDELLAVIKGE